MSGSMLVRTYLPAEQGVHERILLKWPIAFILLRIGSNSGVGPSGSAAGECPRVELVWETVLAQALELSVLATWFAT
jgi:hypothetical protein